jgi:hypothetical protein
MNRRKAKKALKRAVAKEIERLVEAIKCKPGQGMPIEIEELDLGFLQHQHPPSGGGGGSGAPNNEGGT